MGGCKETENQQSEPSASNRRKDGLSVTSWQEITNELLVISWAAGFVPHSTGLYYAPCRHRARLRTTKTRFLLSEADTLGERDKQTSKQSNKVKYQKCNVYSSRNGMTEEPLLIQRSGKVLERHRFELRSK